jgi:hypothetical protein
LLVPDQLRREIDRKLTGSLRIILQHEVSSGRYAKFDERKIGGQAGAYPEDGDAIVEWCAQKIDEHWKRNKEDDSKSLKYRVSFDCARADGKRHRPSFQYLYSGVEDSVVEDDDAENSDQAPTYDPLRTTSAMLAQTHLRLNEAHLHIIELSKASTAHVEPMQALLSSAIQMCGAGMQMMWTGTQVIANHTESLRLEEVSERKFDKVLDFAKKPFNLAARMGLTWAARKFGGSASSEEKTEEAEAVPQVQPDDIQQGWHSRAQSKTPPAEEPQKSDPPPRNEPTTPTDKDRENPLCAMAAAVALTIRPTQWGEISKLLKKREYEAFTAIFEAETDAALLNAWQHAKEAVPFESTMKVFGKLSEEQQGLFMQAQERFDGILEAIEAKRAEQE